MDRAIKALVFDAYGTLYNVGSVERAVAAKFPEHARLITHVWRMKQLEYSWLVTLMDRYEDFWSLTLRSLDYTLRAFDLSANPKVVEDIATAYLNLTPYEDAPRCLEELAPSKRVILSNGSRSMLTGLVSDSKPDRHLDHVLSVNFKRVFKPAPDAYALLEEALGVARSEVVFISANGFDVCGAKSFGFAVVHVKRSRMPPLEEKRSQETNDRVLFDFLRGQRETLAGIADWTVASLADIPALFADGDV